MWVSGGRGGGCSAGRIWIRNHLDWFIAKVLAGASKRKGSPGAVTVNGCWFFHVSHRDVTAVNFTGHSQRIFAFQQTEGFSFPFCFFLEQLPFFSLPFILQRFSSPLLVWPAPLFFGCRVPCRAVQCSAVQCSAVPFSACLGV